MAQFTKYTGTIDGNAGSLITAMDAVLVTGQGWTHPVATSGNIASYRQATGAGFGFVLNDNGPNVTSTTKEAWATGWETIAGVGSPVGSGTGQFPTPAQLLTTGHVVIRKSAATGATTRSYVAFADTSTVYFFIATGDTAGTYYGFLFGDIFAVKGGTDAYRCLIAGRNVENSAVSTAEGADLMQAISGGAVAGNFMARTFGGGGTSITTNKHGDIGKTNGINFVVGAVATPNGADNAYYLSPIWVGESASSTVRGRLRGLYQLMHPIASFSDGQTINGAGDFAGKTFEIIKQSLNAGVYVIETSNTLETN